MYLRSDSFTENALIPTRYAFGKQGSPVDLSDNWSPHLAWGDVPDGAHSFVLTCVDPDAPSCADDVNQEGRVISADLPRVPFVHWLLANIPLACCELVEGLCSDCVTPHGKRAPAGPAGSVQGRNDYSSCFASDPQMSGTYLGYDGPFPPWNDSRVHHYGFSLYALDTARLNLEIGFTLDDLQAAMAGHILATASLQGRYTLNGDILRSW